MKIQTLKQLTLLYIFFIVALRSIGQCDVKYEDLGTASLYSHRIQHFYKNGDSNKRVLLMFTTGINSSTKQVVDFSIFLMYNHDNLADKFESKTLEFKTENGITIVLGAESYSSSLSSEIKGLIHTSRFSISTEKVKFLRDYNLSEIEIRDPKSSKRLRFKVDPTLMRTQIKCVLSALPQQINL